MAAHRSFKGLREALVFLTTTAALVAAQAATPSAKDPAQARYLKEKAACVEGRSNQDRATCLKEADNAYDEAKRRPTGTPDSATLERNAVERCARVKEEDRMDCKRMALGQGQTSGSVEAGGVIKEIITVQPAAPR